jgi:protein-S-isoprenylcysteine O-methyltransferase Ste14
MDRLHLPTALWRRYVHLTPRGAVEFALVVLTLTTATPNVTSLLLGAAVSLTGEAVRIWSAGFSTVVGPSIRGPYLWLRHPYLFGSGLLFLGMALASAKVWVMVATLLVLPLSHLTAFTRGEASLRRSFGPWLAHYLAVVPALLPRLWPARLAADVAELPTLSTTGFSLEYALLRGRHRELDAVLVMLVVGVVLYVLYISSLAQQLHGWFLLGILLMFGVRIIYYATHSRAERPGRLFNHFR